MNKYLTLGLLIALELSCSRPTPLDEALQLSGKNRIHLEQVLRHYSLHPADSLKYRAACFLIENMPGHGWYEGTELDAYHHWVDSACATTNEAFKATLHEACLQWEEMLEKLTFLEDIKHLDSNFLITHIDSTFGAANKRPWLKTLTFEQFCEYILPYRVGHERPRLLYRLQDSLYQTEVKSLLNYDDVLRDASLIFRLQPPYNSFAQSTPNVYKTFHLHSTIIGCVSTATYHLWMSKLFLYPSVMDLTPAYPFRDGRHCWNMVYDNTQTSRFKKFIQENNDYAKVYRQTFSKHLKPISHNNEYIPPFFKEKFYQDVTADYIITSDITITPQTPISATAAYLCVFNELKWEPVAWAPQEKNGFKFNNVGRGIVYLPVIYTTPKPTAISFPFILYPTGQTKKLQPDTINLCTLRLYRKYPQKHTIEYNNQRFTEAFIEASNDSTFHSKDSLGSFSEILNSQWAVTPITKHKPYRYWQIKSSKQFIIGECMLYNTRGKRIIPPESSIIGKREAFDNNPISYIFSDNTCKLTIDLGYPQILSKIECLLQNDGNSVWPGHCYELFYHNGNKWVSLGIKEAQDRWIEFENIPGNALLWLRDLTTGRQERIFTVTDNIINFW